MPGGDGSNPGGAAGSGNDRMIIVVQLIVGALLVMFAALLLVIFKVTNVLGGRAISPRSPAAWRPVCWASAQPAAVGRRGQRQCPHPAGAAFPACCAGARGGRGHGHSPCGRRIARGRAFIVTAGDGLWFVQWGNNSGDYLHTESGGSVTGKAVEQGVAADFADLAAGKWVRVGFTPLGTGQTVYSKETQVQ